jgi:di/tricarboxylate transporter
VLILLGTINYFMWGVIFRTRAGDVVPYWQVFFVLDVSVLLVLIMVLDPPSLPCEAVLVLGSTMFAVAGIFDSSVVLAGLADSTVTSVALLFPMAKAVSDTGILETFVGAVLGTPRSPGAAIFRLYLLVGLLSAVVNNTPMIAMMLPFLELWSQRLGMDVAQLAMPMGFASQLGGSLTLMGSPTNFAAKSIFAAEHFTFNFFEMSLPATALFILGLVYSVLVAPRLLGRRDTDLAPKSANPPDEVLFEVVFDVEPRGAFVGVGSQEAGFERLHGVSRLERVMRAGEELPNDSQLRARDLLIFRASAEGIVALRATRGLRLPVEDEVRLLGAGRRHRAVFEVELPSASKLQGAPVSVRQLRFQQKCALIAVRGRIGYSRQATPTDTELSLTPRGALDFVAGTVVPLRSFEGYVLRDGDVLLVEADRSCCGSASWVCDFGIVRAVPKSSPPRIGRQRDMLRTVGAVLGSATAISLFVASSEVDWLQNLTLTNNLLVLVGLFLVTQTMHASDVYESMDVSVLLTMVGAFPVGVAMENVGLDQWIANGLVSFMSPYGKFGTFFAIYVVTAGLSNLISNVAVIVMMAPICTSIAQLQHIPTRGIVVLTTLAASAVFTCPIGHQTNMMVTPLGRYKWGDFFRFGFLFQLMHMVLCVVLCAALY